MHHFFTFCFDFGLFWKDSVAQANLVLAIQHRRAFKLRQSFVASLSNARSTGVHHHLSLKKHQRSVWWCIHVIPALGKQKQEDLGKLEARLVHMVSSGAV